jgi:hypothetical protein
LKEQSPLLDRRNHVRHRVSAVAYVSLGSLGGGILLDVSNAGMGIQAVGHFAAQENVPFSLELAGTPLRIEGTTEVAWTLPSGQTGFRFLELGEGARAQLNDWLFTNALTGWKVEEPVASSLPLRRSHAPRRPDTSQHSRPSATASSAAAPAESRHMRAVPSPEPRRPAIQPETIVGPFPLTLRSVDANLAGDTHGVYLLGESAGRVFDVIKVGRSDDLKATLAEYLGKYGQFKFALSLSEIEAWERECQFYHQYRPRDNKSHPTRRYGTDWDCPVCHGFS